jgi:DNA-binding XRE family transcriptional regulator
MEELPGFSRRKLFRGKVGWAFMSNSPLADLAPAELGERLRVAREAVNLTQKEAADAISVARTTLVAIEQGQRRIRIGEVQRLAKLYETSVNALLRREAGMRVTLRDADVSQVAKVRRSHQRPAPQR